MLACWTRVEDGLHLQGNPLGWGPTQQSDPMIVIGPADTVTGVGA